MSSANEELKFCYVCGEAVGEHGLGGLKSHELSDGRKICVVCSENKEVNSPLHYTQGDIECIDAMQAMLTREEFIGYLRGTMFAYHWRFMDKDNPVKDLQKLGWYLRRLTELLNDGS